MCICIIQTQIAIWIWNYRYIQSVVFECILHKCCAMEMYEFWIKCVHAWMCLEINMKTINFQFTCLIIDIILFCSKNRRILFYVAQTTITKFNIILTKITFFLQLDGPLNGIFFIPSNICPLIYPVILQWEEDFVQRLQTQNNRIYVTHDRIYLINTINILNVYTNIIQYSPIIFVQLHYMYAQFNGELSSLLDDSLSKLNFSMFNQMHKL